MPVGEPGGDPMLPHIAMMKALLRNEPKPPPHRAGNAPRSIRSFDDA
jgi:hypothetical protein